MKIQHEAHNIKQEHNAAWKYNTTGYNTTQDVQHRVGHNGSTTEDNTT